VVALASLIAGTLGGLVTYAATTRLAAGAAERDPHSYWALGLVGLMPAWLVVFVALLPTAPGGPIPLLSAVAWVFSGAAGLVGVIATEKTIRDTSRVRGGIGGARRCWALGALAIVPAWAIAALVHLLR
jgi:hypothetical protein